MKLKITLLLFLFLFFTNTGFNQTLKKNEKIMVDGITVIYANYELDQDKGTEDYSFSLIGPNTSVYGDLFVLCYGSAQELYDTLNYWDNCFGKLGKQDGVYFTDENNFTFEYNHYSFPLAPVYVIKFPTGERHSFGMKDLTKYKKKLTDWCKKKKIPLNT